MVTNDLFLIKTSAIQPVLSPCNIKRYHKVTDTKKRRLEVVDSLQIN